MSAISPPAHYTFYVGIFTCFSSLSQSPHSLMSMATMMWVHMIGRN